MLAEHDLNPIEWIGRRAARLQESLHGTRILPFVRADLIVAILFAGVAGLSGLATNESLQSGREPQPVSLARIFSAEPMKNPYVEVRALLFPETRLAYPPPYKGMERPVEFAYVAMIDDGETEDSDPTLPSKPESARKDAEIGPPKVLLARFSGDLGHGKPRHVTVSGMLQGPDSLLSKMLEKKRWRLASVPIEQRYVLVAGMTPKPTWLFAPVCAISGCVALALVAAMFRPRSPEAEPNPGA
jgi:hypothetical protein